MEKLITEKKVAAYKIIQEARKIPDAARTEKRALTDEQRAKHAIMMKDAMDLKKDADILEKQWKAETEFKSLDERKVPATSSEEQKGNPALDKAFRSYLQFNGHNELRGLNLTSEAAGGYVAPPPINSKFWTKLDDLLFFRGLADVIPVGKAESLGCPTLENNPADAEWTAEIGSIQEDSTMSFGKRELNPHMLAKYETVSMKMIRNVANIGAFIANRLAYKVATPEENNFMNGDGSAKPLGVFTVSNDGIPTGRDVVSDNSSISPTMKGLKACKWSLKAQYLKNSTWIMHRDVVSLIDLLVDGSGKYEWQPSTQAGSPDVLLGRPLMMSEYAPNTLSANQLVGILGDFKFYQIADAMGISIQVLDQLLALSNKIVYIVRKETDGMPIFGEAFARVKLGA